MPGSLNYSPSGSEGGRSLGGGVTDLEKSLVGVDLTTTPGTTPFKWRNRSNSGGSGGNFVPDGEGSSLPPDKIHTQGQDHIPSRITARRPSSGAVNTPDDTTQALDDPAKIPRTTSDCSAHPTEDVADIARETQHFVAVASVPVDDRGVGNPIEASENRGNIECDSIRSERGQGRPQQQEQEKEQEQQKQQQQRQRLQKHNQSSLSGCASAAAEEIAAALAKGKLRPGEDAASESDPEEAQRTRRQSNPLESADIIRPRTQPPQKMRITNKVIVRNSADSSSIAADDGDGNASAREDASNGECGGFPQSFSSEIPGEVEGGLAGDGGRGSGDNFDSDGQEMISVPRGNGNPEREREDDTLQHTPSKSAAALPGGDTLIGGTARSFQPLRKSQSEGGSNRQTEGGHSLVTSPMNDDEGRKFFADTWRQSSEMTGNAEDGGTREIDGAAQRGETELDSLITGQESGTVDHVGRSRGLSPSSGRDLLQSPPVLHRGRKSSTGGVREGEFDGRGARAGGEPQRTQRGDARSENAGTAASAEALRMACQDSAEQHSTPRGINLPARGTAAEQITPAGGATPRSPVAVAARVISMEESVHCTRRMKKAAEAVSLEDNQMRADAARPAQRRRSFGRSVVLAAPPESDDDDANEQDEEERARYAEKMRVRALRAAAAREDADIERDRALQLTLEVLRRKQAGRRRGISGAHSAPGKTRTNSPPRRSRRPRDHHTTMAKRVKSSAARSCGLSPAQVLLLRRSRELGQEARKQKTASESHWEELAQPKENRPATRIRNPATEAVVEELTRRMSDKEKRAFLHACLADAKECTHRPRTRSTAARGQRAGGDMARGGDEEAKDGQTSAASRDAFLYRVHAQERAKAAAMEHRRGELAYKAVLDKRVCPGCGAEQSYDEVQEQRKTCPNCEVEYRKPRTWAGVKKGFLNRMDTFEESRRHALQSAQEHKELEIRMLAQGGYDFPRKTDLETESEWAERARLFWEDIEDDFITRLREDAARRRASLESRSATLPQDCTFRPTLSANSERVMADSAWAGMNFLERMEGDLQRRREATPAFNANDDGNFSFGGDFSQPLKSHSLLRDSLRKI